MTEEVHFFKGGGPFLKMEILFHGIKGNGKMKKGICVWAGLLFCAIAAAGCSGGVQPEGAYTLEKNKTTVELTIWGAEEDEELLEQLIRGFEKEYEGEADFHITFEAHSESQCKDDLLADLEAGADVFTFADDQLNALAAAGALEPVENAGEIMEANLSSTVEAASVAGTLYAYPLTADNGYFLYFNRQYFSDEDVETLDRILETAAENGKLFAMDWTSAWYVYAFFGNTGLEVGLNPDGITNFCTWNGQDGEIRGVDVAQTMLKAAASTGFESRTDLEFMEGVRDGSVIAGVSGVWNAVALEEIWGENLGAAKLPTYTCRGRQIQMASFSGCKLVGANAYSKKYEWAVRLAEWITKEQSQELRFAMRGQGPSNNKAAMSAAVQESPAIAALLEQSEFSDLQRVGGHFWDPVAEFAKNMAAGNPTGEDLQKQLDKMTEDIIAR